MIVLAGGKETTPIVTSFCCHSSEYSFPLYPSITTNAKAFHISPGKISEVAAIYMFLPRSTDFIDETNAKCL